LPLDWTPLADVGEGARKVLSGPAPLKLMAARGLAPLKPVELAVVLYHLAQPDGEAPIVAAAQKSIGELPEKILAAALADPGLDPRVLDFFATRVHGKPALVDTILLNRATADQTVVELVPRLAERELELVAVNEARLLRTPAVIGALYMNPKARMSTVDRCVELAVRNQITVPGIPRWDDVVTAVLGLVRKGRGELQEVPAENDDAFAAVARVAIGADPVEFAGAAAEGEGEEDALDEAERQKIEEEKKNVPIDQLSVPAKLRLATLGNAFARAFLIRDTIKIVAIAAINSPGMTDQEVVKYSANRSLADDVIRVIANTKEWTKLYKVKVNLCNNPKCPLPTAMRLLPFLHDRDLRNLARSKGISSALSTQAKKILSQKGH
jgi:hypothetical protein